MLLTKDSRVPKQRERPTYVCLKMLKRDGWSITKLTRNNSRLRPTYTSPSNLADELDCVGATSSISGKADPRRE